MSWGKIINAQWLIQANSNDNVKVPHHWPCMGKPPKTRGFPWQMPVMKKAFLCRDDIVNRGGEISGMPTICRNWQRFIYHPLDQTHYWSFWNYWHCRSIWKTALRFNPNIVFLKLHWGIVSWNMAKMNHDADKMCEIETHLCFLINIDCFRQCYIIRFQVEIMHIIHSVNISRPSISETWFSQPGIGKVGIMKSTRTSSLPRSSDGQRRHSRALWSEWD